MSPSATRAELDTVRSFNRTVTAAIGTLDESLMDTGYALSEARVIYDLAQADAVEVGDLRSAIGLDSGYLSRLLARLEARGLLRRSPSPADGRRQVAELTPAGRQVFSTLDERADRAAAAMLDIADRDRLVAAMGTVRDVLSDAPPPRTVLLRPAGSGDWGWIVQRHGELYAAEFGWGERFEALVARIVADHLETRDPHADGAWIAEVDGERVGTVMCVREDESTAKLRLLLVEPRARGLGVGTRLVEECLRFARRAGYRRMVLWTNEPLRSARPIYEAAGFALVAEEDHTDFGPTVTGQTFALDLAGPA